MIRFSFPITKFEKLEDGRMVIEGTATDETLDSQGDVLDYEGSKKAFGDWRGNVREAHDPHKMVGKALEVDFDDTKKAIGVKAFISSGAGDTQAKIEEGVLASFSVGGGVPTKVQKEKKPDGRVIRRVLEWPMSELSVVDAGANPNATFQLVKADGLATEVLAAEISPAVADAANRFAAALLKAIPQPIVEKAKKADEEKDGDGKGGEAEKKPAEGEEKEACDKCDKVHKEGIEACDKQELAAAETARAKKGVEEAKAKHKVAQAKEGLAGAKAKLEEVKGGDEEKKPDEVDADATSEKTTQADGIAKSPVDLDLGDAVAILSRIRSLHSVEASEDVSEAAQLALLDAADDNIRQFIALEATEPPESAAADAMPLAANAKTSSAVFVKTLFEAIKKEKAGEAPSETFTTHHGDQLAEGIGKGFQAFLEPLSKALGDLKVDIDEIKAAREKVDIEKALEASPLLKTMGETIEKIAKQPAVIMPLRNRAGLEGTAPPKTNTLADDLERVMVSVNNPEAQVAIKQRIAFLRAGVSE